MAKNNDAFTYVTGPCHLYLRVPSIGAGPNRSVAQLQQSNQDILFVGHTEQYPEPAFEDMYKPVMCSLSGEAIEDESVFLGKKAKLVVDLQRFDMEVISLMMNAPRFNRAVGALPAAAVGSESYLDRGRLVQGHGDSYEFWVKFSFYNTVNAAIYPNLIPGYYFPCCITAGTYPTKLTRDAKKVRLMIEPKSVRAGITGGWTLFSQNPTYFTRLPDPG